MQDLEKFQIDIIDKIFHSDDSPTTIQRIGDINQAIYSSGKKVKDVADWQPREPKLYIRGSNRLTPEVAGIVNYFTLDRQRNDAGQALFEVHGRRELNQVIKPHLIVFNKETMGQLATKFREIIKQFSLQKTREAEKYGFKIIGWSAKWDDEDKQHKGKLRLEDIFSEYKKDKASRKETFDSLSNHIQFFDVQKKTLVSASNSILNAFVHILRLEEKKYAETTGGKERFYTKQLLLKAIRDRKDAIDYENFKAKLYEWAFGLSTKRNYSDIYTSVKGFIKSDFKDWFKLSITEDVEKFIGTNFEQLTVEKEIVGQEEKTGGIKIDIGTVHSAKGQTHCATMYVETSYHNYETNKMKGKKGETPNPLFKKEHQFDGKRSKEALKMMYVGFSRPTHLLCWHC
jgi:hypothetical protein